MVTKSYKVISCWLQYCNPLLRWLLPCPAAPGLMLALLCYCLPCYCCWVRALLCGPSQISWMCFNFRKHATSRGRARAASSASSASSSARAAASSASCARARRQLHQQWRQTLLPRCYLGHPLLGVAAAHVCRVEQKLLIMMISLILSP